MLMILLTSIIHTVKQHSRSRADTMNDLSQSRNGGGEYDMSQDSAAARKGALIVAGIGVVAVIITITVIVAIVVVAVMVAVEVLYSTSSSSRKSSNLCKNPVSSRLFVLQILLSMMDMHYCVFTRSTHATECCSPQNCLWSKQWSDTNKCQKYPHCHQLNNVDTYILLTYLILLLLLKCIVDSPAKPIWYKKGLII